MSTWYISADQVVLESTFYGKFVSGRLQEMFIFITDLDHFTGSLSKLSVSTPTKQQKKSKSSEWKLGGKENRFNRS